jgi:hypothetical protein
MPRDSAGRHEGVRPEGGDDRHIRCISTASYEHPSDANALTVWVLKAKARKASYRYDDHNAAGDLDVLLMPTPMKRRCMGKVSV